MRPIEPKMFTRRITRLAAMVAILALLLAGAPGIIAADKDAAGSTEDDSGISEKMSAELSNELKSEAHRIGKSKQSYAPVKGVPAGLKIEKVSAQPVEHYKLLDSGDVQAAMIVRLIYEDRQVHQLWEVVLSPDGSSWKVGSPKLIQTADNYYKRTVADKGFSVTDFRIDQDNAQFHFEQADVTPVTIPDGRVVGAILTGKGRFTFEPLDKVERRQLKLRSERESLDETVDKMLLSFHPSQYEMHFPLDSRGAPSAKYKQRDHESLFKQRLRQYEAQDDFFNVSRYDEWMYVDFESGNYSWLVYAFDPGDIKECQLYNPIRVPGITDKQYFQLWSHYHSKEDRKRHTDYELERETRADINTLSIHLAPTLTRKTVLNGKVDMRYVTVVSDLVKTDFSLHEDLAIKYILDGQERPLLHVGGGYGREVYFREPKQDFDTDKFIMEYEGKGVIEQFTPDLYSLAGFAGSWFPSWEFWGSSRLDMELEIRAPHGLEVLSIGQVRDEWREDNYDVKVFRPDFPVVTPVIVFGKFTKKSMDVDGIAITTYLSQSGLGATDFAGGGQPIPARRLDSVLIDARNSIALYNKWFGRYPFGKLDLVNSVFHGFGAQAPPSLIFIGNGLYSTKSQRQSFFRNVNTGQGVVAHEVGHEWWGHVVRPISNYHYWWVESLAQIAEALFIQQVVGDEAYKNEMSDWRRLAIEGDKWGTLQNGYRAGRHGPQLIYYKGPYVFHMMRMMVGDERFSRFLKFLIKNHYGEAICTRDIQNAAQMAFGMEMERFFDEWIRGNGIPRYDWGFEITQAESGEWVVRGRIKQRVFIGDELQEEQFQMPVRLWVYWDGDVRREVKRIWVQSGDTSFAFSFKDKPERVDLNQFGAVLAETQLHELGRLDKAVQGDVKIGSATGAP